MATLLALEHVSKRYREGRRERVVLRDIDLELRSGELVVVYGARRSGRTTLLRIAAGIERLDSGSVCFEGHDLAERGERVLGRGIGYVQKTLRSSEEQGVLEQVAAPLLAHGVSVSQARARGREALALAGAEDCAGAAVAELGSGERVRVALARTLALSPAALIVDEPAAGVELAERTGILALLRTLAGAGVSVLASTGEPDELAGAQRALTIGDGELRGPSSPELARVVALRRTVV